MTDGKHQSALQSLPLLDSCTNLANTSYAILEAHVETRLLNIAGVNTSRYAPILGQIENSPDPPTFLYTLSLSFPLRGRAAFYWLEVLRRHIILQSSNPRPYTVALISVFLEVLMLKLSLLASYKQIQSPAAQTDLIFLSRREHSEKQY
jgi:hypothetical protein